MNKLGVNNNLFREIEFYSTLTGGWQAISFNKLTKHMVFRIFEDSEKTKLVKDAKGYYIFKAEDNAYTNSNGVGEILCSGINDIFKE